MFWSRTGSLLFILLILFCIPEAGALSVPDYDKILQIHLQPADSGYQVTAMEIRYGRAPHLDVQTGVLEASLQDPANNVLLVFSLRDPAFVQADSMNSEGSGTLIGYTGTVTPDEMIITVPYRPDMQTFRLTDSRSGSVIASADLAAPAAMFCSGYPADPDCIARAQSQKSPSPDSSKLLILAVLFSASVLLAVIHAILAIRRRTAVSAPAPGGAVVEKAPKRQQHTVLIVDDNPDIVDLIHHLLDLKGYRTLTADSGGGCLDVLRHTLPDLIILDVGMTPMDGWQTLEQIKKDPVTRSIPVLMLTAHNLTALSARQYKIYIEDYITKPFQLDGLGLAIDRIIERKRKLNESLVLAKQAGVDMDTFCEFARLTRHITVNKRIVSVMQIPQVTPMMADLNTLDEMSVVDYLNITTKDHEKRAEQLREELNTSFRSKGLPELDM